MEPRERLVLLLAWLAPSASSPCCLTWVRVGVGVRVGVRVRVRVGVRVGVRVRVRVSALRKRLSAVAVSPAELASRPRLLHSTAACLVVVEVVVAVAVVG